MAGNFARHMTKYFHAGFWTTLIAAVLNGTYWRLPLAVSVQVALAGLTAAVAIAGIVLNARFLWQRKIAGGRTGYRVSWLLLITGLLIVGSVLIGLTNRAEYWQAR